MQELAQETECFGFLCVLVAYISLLCVSEYTTAEYAQVFVNLTVCACECDCSFYGCNYVLIEI